MSESDPDSQVNQAISQISSTIAELELTPAIRTPQPTSSIDQVPTELLSLIFDFACSNNLLQEYPWISVNEVPTKLSSPIITYLPALVISAVCTRWRCIALALPGLWARLRLEISEKPATSDVFMAILQLYLDHSAHAPLFLDLFIGLTDNGKDDHNPPALDLLLEHTRRWKSLQYITDRKISKTMLSLPILEVLAIECPWGDAVAEDGLDCFQVAPKLHTLTMREEYNPGRYIGYEDLFLSQLPRHQLTSLNAALDYDGLAILQDLSNLTTLELCVYHYYKRNQPQTLLCRLKSFTLIVHLFYWPRDSESLHHILTMFTLPSLNELVICDKDCSGKLAWPASAFQAFISRSSCVLMTLCISGITISDWDFIVVLRLFPSLTKLIFQHGDLPTVTHPITPLFLTSLALRDSDSGSVSDSHSILVPNLCALSIKVGGTSFDDSTFVDMITSRWLPDPSYTGVASLRSVVLRFREREVDEDVYRGLYELDKVGMRWGREVNEEADLPLRPISNLERMGMRVVITGKDFTGI